LRRSSTVVILPVPNQQGVLLALHFALNRFFDIIGILFDPIDNGRRFVRILWALVEVFTLRLAPKPWKLTVWDEQWLQAVAA
jgi:hypothetical protein